VAIWIKRISKKNQMPKLAMVKALCSGPTGDGKENLSQNLLLAYLVGYQKGDARAARYEKP
jgi:hypothetical protein